MSINTIPLGYARMNVNGCRTSFVITSVCSSIHNPFQAHSLQHSCHPIRSRPTAYSTVTIQFVPDPQPTAQLPSNPFQAHSLQHSYHPIRSSPTAYSTVTIQHNQLNRKNIIQNQKYKCKSNIKLIYLTFIRCTNKQITELN